jgi:hypothetical protein
MSLRIFTPLLFSTPSLDLASLFAIWHMYMFTGGTHDFLGAILIPNLAFVQILTSIS